jgi:Na+/H+ antiporter NhaD/arsenite permease-like protein
VLLLSVAVVVGALVAMASGRVPATLVLATAIAIAGIFQLAPPADLFAGLSNGGVITVAAMLVIAKGVIHTGVVSRVTWRLLRTATSATQVLLRLIAPIGGFSAMINTTPIVAMLIPAARELQQTRQIPARQVLLPMAHATTLAGSTTLIGTSSNLLIAGIATSAGITVGMFSFAPVAIPVMLFGWAILLFTAPRVLKSGGGSTPVASIWQLWPAASMACCGSLPMRRNWSLWRHKATGRCATPRPFLASCVS